MGLGDLLPTAESEDADEYDDRVIQELVPRTCPPKIWQASVRFSRFVRLAQYYLWYREQRPNWSRFANLQDAIDSLLEEEGHEDIKRNHLWNNFAPAYSDRINSDDGDDLWKAIADDLEQIACGYVQWEAEESTAEIEDND
ncbi:hypothetical protein ACNS7O_18675 (plasmid) [Haloferacaceae archaeon DSL9]